MHASTIEGHAADPVPNGHVEAQQQEEHRILLMCLLADHPATECKRIAQKAIAEVLGVQQRFAKQF